ncbi:hypothetical protein AFK20_01685 [Enhydrobacter aerosaccus]|jgi:hypothetical protein|uniref:Intracellular multiplication protein IcmT n=1 Tax=Enhydrobacter aerosaccus TaxID=225324 RepID=A0ABR5IP66_9HYPH|nr:hypothetical protein [Enhydrobacter aerosaccus]KND22834.1 hypothetical protein AFK20_01685 [Enhydrobacter aerosaccus]
MAVKQKLSELADSYIGFIDYGVRAWFFAFFAFLTILVIERTGFFDMAGILLLYWLVSLIVVGLWTRDYTRGYVPVWWLRLGYGKKAKARMKLGDRKL